MRGCIIRRSATWTALARAFPGTGICLNHVGGPLAIGHYAGMRDEVFATWSKSIRELWPARTSSSNLGGMAMRINGWDFHEKADPPSSETLAAAWKPYVETCIEAFGANRCMFESNFPVDKGSYGYAPFWNACKLLAKGRECRGKDRSVQRHRRALLTYWRQIRHDPARPGHRHQRDIESDDPVEPGHDVSFGRVIRSGGWLL
jgi:hypothetical protein